MKYFEVPRAGRTIRGMIHRPANQTGRRPGLIYCHGFTASRIEPHFMYVKIARALADLGIVSIRFDFLGSGESDGEFKDMTLSGEVADCEAVIDYAETLDFVDSGNINLLGFSMGAAVAAITAAHRPGLIKNAILISTAANILEVFTKDIKGDAVEAYLNRGYFDYQGNLLSKPAIDDAFKINIYEQAGLIKGPVLLVHGSRDDIVPPFTSLKLAEILGDQARLKLIRDADHHFSSAPFETELISTITQFVQDKINKT
ncbi:MAG: alpha/beta fold hydrolase [Firmicutes bacterium]|nr:alpha/beta fold hydrolase [Bacillota bacterium]